MFLYFLIYMQGRLLILIIATPLRIGITVEHCGEKYKIIHHEKPHTNFARHYIIRSLQTGQIQKVYRHEIFEISSSNQPPTAAVSSIGTATEMDTEMEQSQSDNELLDVEIEESDAVPENPNPTSRFKAVPSAEVLDSIAMARTEPTTNRQTTWGVKLFRGAY